MSTGGPPDGAPARPNNDFRATAIAIGVCALFVLLLYVFVGRHLFHAARIAAENQQEQADMRQSLDDAASRNQDFQNRLQEFKNELANNGDVAEVRKKLAQLQAEFDGNRDKLRGLDQQAAVVEADQSLQRAKVADAYFTGKGIGKNLKALEKELAAFQGTLAGLNLSQDGRKIAADNELLKQYVALTLQTPVSSADVDRWRGQWDALFPRIEAGFKDKKLYAPVDDAIQNTLKKLAADTVKARNELRQFQRALDVLIVSAKALQASDVTLQDAIAAKRQNDAKAFAKRLADQQEKSKQQVEQSYADKLAKEQAKQLQLLKEQQLETERLNTKKREEELARIQAQRALVQKQQARAKLLAEMQRDMPLIRSLLSPFLDAAITQPARGNPIKRVSRRIPTSLAALQGSGALEDSDAGREFLYRVGGHKGNLRRKGAFPIHSDNGFASPVVRNQVQRAQQLLLKYGDLLVEQRLLSP